MVAFPASFQLPLAAYGAGLLPAAAYGGGFPGLAVVAVVVTGFVPGHPAGFIRGAVGRPFVGIGHGAARAFVFAVAWRVNGNWAGPLRRDAEVGYCQNNLPLDF